MSSNGEKILANLKIFSFIKDHHFYLESNVHPQTTEIWNITKAKSLKMICKLHHNRRCIDIVSHPRISSYDAFLFSSINIIFWIFVHYSCFWANFFYVLSTRINIQSQFFFPEKNKLTVANNNNFDCRKFYNSRHFSGFPRQIFSD